MGLVYSKSFLSCKHKHDGFSDKKVVQGDNWGDLRVFGLVIFTTKGYNWVKKREEICWIFLLHRG